MKKYFTVLIYLFFISISYSKTIYIENNNSNTVYTDTPSGNGTKIDIPDSHTEIEKRQDIKAAPIKQEQTTAVGYESIEITSPTNEQTFQNQRNIPVVVKTVPELKEGNEIALYVDNNLYASSTKMSDLELQQLDRGMHKIYVSIIDSKKNILKKSDVIIIYVMYAHK